MFSASPDKAPVPASILTLLAGIDRGFQIYLTAYPEGKRFLDYDKLNFKKFYPGAIVRKDGRFHRVADPLRSPKDIFATLTSPLGKPADKVKVACLQKQLQMESIEDIFDKPECTTYEVLRREGFSRQMIDHFPGRCLQTDRGL